MIVRLKERGREAYFSMEGFYFKGVIENKIFTITRIMSTKTNMTCPHIFLDRRIVRKVVDKHRFITYSSTLKHNLSICGIEYEN